MADTSFYSTQNHHNEIELTIVNASLLVSKPPTKEKRVRIKVRMLLSGSVNMGSPSWLDKAYAYVAENGDKISPQLELRGYGLQFSADNLFEKDGVKAVHCDMCSFEIVQFGSTEEPEVVANFCIYLPFSAAIWQWLGAYGGESCWCSFTPGVPEETPEPTDDQPALTSGDDEENEEDEEDDEAEGQEIDSEELDPDNEVTAQDDDVVLEDALHVFESHGKVSAVALQRVLQVSYVKAAHIIDRMEVKGMVSKADENGVRSLSASAKKPAKNEPKNLAAYHEKVVDQEVKRGRGRPRKTPVDPLTVNTATAF
jgi:hypothetical protein